MKRDKYIIAIDGPAGAGKSTVSKSVARRMGYLYIDTGGMYRALALKAERQGVVSNDEAALTTLAQTTDITLTPSTEEGKLLDIFLDGENVGDKIRTEGISQAASKISTVRGVRTALQEKQRAIGKAGGVVMEGRDIGTAVFPDAEFKFYLDASVEERAGRRYRELKAKGASVTLEEIAAEVRQRDDRDKNRPHDPLRQAPDAIYIDSDGLTIEGTADVLVEKIRERENVSRHGN